MEMFICLIEEKASRVEGRTETPNNINMSLEKIKKAFWGKENLIYVTINSTVSNGIMWKIERPESFRSQRHLYC